MLLPNRGQSKQSRRSAVWRCTRRGRTVRQRKTLLLTFAITALLCGFSGQAMVVSPAKEFNGPITTEGGGRTLLVEEITATWCPKRIAEIDPELLQVADSHGSRIALVALHPSDGEDAFQPEASQHRIDRLETVEAGVSTSTPTFVVEAGPARRGYDAWADVQRDISMRNLHDKPRLADVTVEKTGEGYRASIAAANLTEREGTQLTMLIVQHAKPMPEGYVNPGLDHRDRVVVGLAECSLDNHTITANLGLLSASANGDCSTSFSVAFEA